MHQGARLNNSICRRRLVLAVAGITACAFAPPTLLATPIQWEGNRHYYEIITVGSGLSWSVAEADAQNRHYRGMQGYLATVTSQAESDFLKEYLLSGAPEISYWIGGHQPPGSPEPDGGWTWVTTEAWGFTNWRAGEPNNSGGDEDSVEIYADPQWLGQWNDLPDGLLPRHYIIEYEPVRVWNPDNGHWYELVEVEAGLTWNEAESEAQSRSFDIWQGYLVCLADQEENNFVRENLLATAAGWSYWIGSVQPPGSPEPDGGWGWITGEPFTFENWAFGGPNNAGGDEDVIEMYADDPSLIGQWNDLNRLWSCVGYIVEYGPPNSLIVSNETVTELWGNIDEYDAVYVINGGSIVVPEAQWDGGTWIGGYLMLEADTIYIDSSSSIHADGVGFSEDDGYSGGGPGQGAQGGDVTCAICGGGGAFGGMGGSCWTTAQPGTSYGPADQDDTSVGTLFGSTGGDYSCTDVVPPFETHSATGGRGGGYIRLRGSDINVEGTVTADGAPGEVADPQWPANWAGIGSGGGAGGQIVIEGDTVNVSGTLRAQGGDGSDPSYWESGGGGSGGRIKIFATMDFVCGGTIHAPGGDGACSGMADGSAGTVHLPGIPSPAPTITGLVNDTGRDPGDLITNDPTIGGTAEPGSTVKLYAGGAVVGTGQADPGTGDFAVPASGAADGLVEVTATAQGSCHTESSPSDSFTFTLDRQPPASPSTPDLNWLSDKGRFISDDITNDVTPTFDGTAGLDTEIVLREGETELGSTITPDGNWSVTSLSLAEGTHQISAKAIDVAGNESGASVALSILIDLTDPVISNPSATPTNCPHPGVVFDVQITATDALSGVQDAWNPEATIRLGDTQIDDFDLAPLGGSTFGSSWDSTDREPGTYAVDFEAWDLAGNAQQFLDGASICLAVPADLDEDGDVDLDDFSIFAGCMLGPGVAYLGGCEGADFDGDADVDVADFAMFQRFFSGS